MSAPEPDEIFERARKRVAVGNMVGGIGLVTLNRFTQAKSSRGSSSSSSSAA